MLSVCKLLKIKENLLVGDARLERAAPGFGGQCSIQLS